MYRQAAPPSLVLRKNTRAPMTEPYATKADEINKNKGRRSEAIRPVCPSDLTTRANRRIIRRAIFSRFSSHGKINSFAKAGQWVAIAIERKSRRGWPGGGEARKEKNNPTPEQRKTSATRDGGSLAESRRSKLDFAL